MVIKSMMVGKQEVETFAPFDRAELDNHQQRTPVACRLCTSCSLLPANLPLFSRHLQLPIPLGVDLRSRYKEVATEIELLGSKAPLTKRAALTESMRKLIQFCVGAGIPVECANQT